MLCVKSHSQQSCAPMSMDTCQVVAGLPACLCDSRTFGSPCAPKVGPKTCIRIGLEFHKLCIILGIAACRDHIRLQTALIYPKVHGGKLPNCWFPGGEAAETVALRKSQRRSEMLQASTQSQQQPQAHSAAVPSDALPTSRSSDGSLAAGGPLAQVPRLLPPQPSGRPPLPPTEMLKAQVISHALLAIKSLVM